MNHAADPWDELMRAAGQESAALEAGVANLAAEAMHQGAERERARALAGLASSIAASGRRAGAERVAGLAGACERCLLLSMDRVMPPELGLWLLAPAVHTLRRALDTLVRAGREGTAAVSVPLEAACFELEAAMPASGHHPDAPDVPVSALRRGPAGRTDPDR